MEYFNEGILAIASLHVSVVNLSRKCVFWEMSSVSSHRILNLFQDQQSCYIMSLNFIHLKAI